MGFRNHLDHKKTRRTLRRLISHLEELMTEGIARVDAALEGIRGDIMRLKDAGAALQAALDEALAGKDQAVADAVAAERAAFDAALAPLVAKAEALDAENPAPEVPEKPTDPEGISDSASFTD